MPKRDAKKRPRKKPLKYSAIGLAAIVIIALVAYTINVNVKLLFDTETHITLDPSMQSITLPDKTPPEINFTTTIDKLSACTLSCTYTLSDTSHNQILNQTTITPPKKLVQTYTLPLPSEGQGQSIFNYHVKCETTQKKFCPSSGKTYEKTSFVTVNYDLDGQEQARKAVLQETLPAQAALLAKLQTMEQERSMLQTLLENKTRTHLKQATSQEQVLQQLSEEEIAIHEAWQRQHYEEASSRADLQAANLQELNTTITTRYKTITAAFNDYNDALKLLADIHNQSVNTRILDESTRAELGNDNKTYQTIITNPENYDPSTFLTISQSIARTLANATIEAANKSSTQPQAEINLAKTYNRTNKTITCDDLNALTASIDEKDQQENTTTSKEPITTFNETYCKTPLILFKDEPPNQLTKPNSTPATPRSLPATSTTCCYKNECTTCEAQQGTPIIMVHGHSFSKSTSPELAFARTGYLQASLAQDGYVHASTLNQQARLETIPAGDWGKNPHPIVMGMTYYYLNYYDLEKLSFTTRKTERIENYAIRLHEAITTVKEKTGSDDVILIAHSMGGLVARSYLQVFGDEDVKALIILGTPNQGIEGDIRKYCTITGAKEECEDMEAGSTFIKKLETYEPSTTKIYTIRAVGCPTKNDQGEEEAGDGVVLARNVPLSYATNYQINGTCTDLLQKDLHMNFVNPNLYPETYTLIKTIIDEIEATP